jgi:hypothetical protein
MRRIFVILFFCSLGHAQTATVTGKVVDPGNANQTINTKVQFELIGCSGNQPRYNGTALLWPLIKKFDTDSSGNISGSIFKNDSITCGSSTDSNKWRMTIVQNGQPSPPCDVRITSSTFNATQPNCLNQNPTVAVPTDSTRFALLNATNMPFTGIISSTRGANIGDQSGFLAFATVPYYDAAVNFWGILNRPLQSGNPNQLNGVQIFMQDDNGTIPNEVALYSAFVDNHTSGTRLSNAGFESDVYQKSAGTTNGQSGVIGYSEVDAGTVTNAYGTFGNATVKGGTVTSNAGLYGISAVTGGTLTNSYAALLAGPSISGGTVTNNYGLYIGAVGSAGTTRNFQIYSESTGSPFTVSSSGAIAGPSIAINGGTAITAQTGSGGTVVMSSGPSITSPTVVTGIAADGSGFKHKRVATGSVSASTRASVAVTWGTAFADANYTATCTMLESGAGATSASLVVERINLFAAASVTVTVLNNDAGSARSGTLLCMAVHD